MVGRQRLLTIWTQGVVTPNMVSPSAGLSSVAGSGMAFLIIPAIAWAALPSTRREMRFSPCMSVTEDIIAMSEGPT